MDAAGNAYLTGFTAGTDFPTSAGAPQRTYAGGVHDAFVIKINPAGSAMVWGTYLGGTRDENLNGLSSRLAVDSNSNVYVLGITNSPDYSTRVGSFQPNPADPNSTDYGDVFVTKIDAAGHIVYSTLATSKKGAHFDFTLVATASHQAIDGHADDRPANDACPHPAGTGIAACAGKGPGGSLVVDLVAR